MLIPDFSRGHILVVGDLMLDRYWHGPTSRISPEAPVPVVRVTEIEERAGGAANVALNIAALGARATVLGLTGLDEAATALKSRLAAEPAISAELIGVPGLPTITKLRVMSRHQQLLRMDFEEDFARADHGALHQRFDAMLGEAAVVLFSDYGKGSLRDVQTLIERARAAGRPTLIDPKGLDFERYRGATLLTPNQAEFEAVAGRCANDAELADKGLKFARRLDLTALLVTRSERGMTLLQPAEGSVLHLPTRAREVYDVTGAGDTVIATLAAGLAVGLGFAQAAALANIAAGIVVGKLGTATVTTQELQRAVWTGHTPLQRGVVDESALLGLVRQARASGERIVMTNGCFDLLHAGHVAYLSQARELGDRLIVAVNDDASVARLKGSGRPVNALAERMAVLAGLESVDWVVPFSEDTPERLICAVLPDVLVKGGDYKPDQIAGGQCVREHGGEVVVTGFIEGRSTTALIDAIRKPR